MSALGELDLAWTRRLAEELAEEASRWLGSAGQVSGIAFKADTSIVTDADLAVQKLIVDRLERECPDHAIVAEEGTERRKDEATKVGGRYCWVIDPIDGTRNYAVGFPCFATSIALLDNGVPVVGVVREHNTGLTYSAAAGVGCHGRLACPCTGGPAASGTRQAMRVRGKPLDGDRIVAFPSSKDDLTVRVGRLWVARPGIVPRNVGSTAVHLALLAAGAVEAVYARRCKIWDIAAGALLVTEAGGVITRLDGGQLFPWPYDADPDANVPVLAGTADLHGELLKDFQV